MNKQHFLINSFGSVSLENSSEKKKGKNTFHNDFLLSFVALLT